MRSWWPRCSAGGRIAPTLPAAVACPVPGRSSTRRPRPAARCDGRVLEHELGRVRNAAAGRGGLVVAAAGGLPGGDLGHQRGQRHRQRHPTDRLPPSSTPRGQQAASQQPQLPRHRTRLGRVSAGRTGGAVEPVRRRSPPFPPPTKSVIGEGGEQVGGGRGDPVAVLTAGP